MVIALGDVPQWTQQIVERSIHTVCPCCSYPLSQASPRLFGNLKQNPVRDKGREALDSVVGGVFEGRRNDLGRLRAFMKEVLSGTGRIVCWWWPEIGKTRTAEGLRTYAGMQGTVGAVGEVIVRGSRIFDLPADSAVLIADFALPNKTRICRSVVLPLYDEKESLVVRSSYSNPFEHPLTPKVILTE